MKIEYKYAKAILFDGSNHQEVYDFIEKYKSSNDDIEMVFGEGEVYHKGSYYKAQCYILWEKSQGFYVIMERFIDAICKETYK